MDDHPPPPIDLAQPRVGAPVHYVSYGTPGGEYRSRCRAAVVTEVGQWITTDETGDWPDGDGRPVRRLEQTFYDDAAALFVTNPTGVFFNGAGTVACKHDPSHHGGTWHWAGEGGCTA